MMNECRKVIAISPSTGKRLLLVDRGYDGEKRKSLTIEQESFDTDDMKDSVWKVLAEISLTKDRAKDLAAALTDGWDQDFEIEESINKVKGNSEDCEIKINYDVESIKEVFNGITTTINGMLAPVISAMFDSPFKEFTIMFARNLNFALSICEIKDDPFEIGSFFDKGHAYIVWRTIEAHIKKYPCGNASVKEAIASIEHGDDEDKSKADSLCNLYKENYMKYGSNQIDILVGFYTHDKLHASAAIDVLLSAIKSFVAR